MTEKHEMAADMIFSGDLSIDDKAALYLKFQFTPRAGAINAYKPITPSTLSFNSRPRAGAADEANRHSHTKTLDAPPPAALKTVGEDIVAELGNLLSKKHIGK